RLSCHEPVGIAEELLGTGRVTVAHQVAQLGELALDALAAFRARHAGEARVQIARAGTLPDACEHRAAGPLDAERDRGVRHALVVDVVAVELLGPGRGDEPRGEERAGQDVDEDRGRGEVTMVPGLHDGTPLAWKPRGASERPPGRVPSGRRVL